MRHYELRRLAEGNGSRTHPEPITALTGFEDRPPHRERFPSNLGVSTNSSCREPGVRKLCNQRRFVLKAPEVEAERAFRDRAEHGDR